MYKNNHYFMITLLISCLFVAPAILAPTVHAMEKQEQEKNNLKRKFDSESEEKFEEKSKKSKSIKSIELPPEIIKKIVGFTAQTPQEVHSLMHVDKNFLGAILNKNINSETDMTDLDTQFTLKMLESLYEKNRNIIRWLCYNWDELTCRTGLCILRQEITRGFQLSEQIQIAVLKDDGAALSRLIPDSLNLPSLYRMLKDTSDHKGNTIFHMYDKAVKKDNDREGCASTLNKIKQKINQDYRALNATILQRAGMGLDKNTEETKTYESIIITKIKSMFHPFGLFNSKGSLPKKIRPVGITPAGVRPDAFLWFLKFMKATGIPFNTDYKFIEKNDGQNTVFMNILEYSIREHDYALAEYALDNGAPFDSVNLNDACVYIYAAKEYLTFLGRLANHQKIKNNQNIIQPIATSLLDSILYKKDRNTLALDLIKLCPALLNLTDKDKNMPLHNMALKGNATVLKIGAFMASNNNLESQKLFAQQNAFGKTPLHILLDSLDIELFRTVRENFKGNKNNPAWLDFKNVIGNVCTTTTCNLGDRNQHKLLHRLLATPSFWGSWVGRENHTKALETFHILLSKTAMMENNLETPQQNSYNQCLQAIENNKEFGRTKEQREIRDLILTNLQQKLESEIQDWKKQKKNLL